MKHLFALVLCSTLLIPSSLFSKSPGELVRDYAAHVTIVRDQWGVPHIYGKTDADAAYGLAWANAEDDFKTMQEILLIAKGKYGLFKGKDGAIVDFFRNAIGTDRIVPEQFNTFSDKFQEYLNGYITGVNDYAAANPDEILLKGIFPTTAMDVAKGAFVNMAFLSDVPQKLQKVLEGNYTKEEAGKGSNAFAFSSKITKDDNTYLCINPHQPLQGLFSWYEAHLVSEEGLDVMGATFPGGQTIYVGTTPNLGWAHTVNGINKSDVFELEMNPDEKLQYKFDGEWLELEKIKVKLKVKLKKWLFRIPVKKTVYWSKYGATFKSKDNKFYSVRYPANMEIRAIEQWYHMNKAKNFKAFSDALKMNSIPMFNVVYADKEDNIYYLNNGMIPVRDSSYNWHEILPGNTSKTLWTELVPTEKLPQILNPECGYVYNMNNTPYDATCSETDITYSKFPVSMGFRMGNTNRSMRFMEFMNEYPFVSFEDMKMIKFDSQFPDSSLFLSSLQQVLDLKGAEHPELEDILKVIKQWNGNPTPDSKAASALLVTLGYLFEKFNYNDNIFREGLCLGDEEYVEALAHAKKHLLKYFGSVEVSLEDLQRHRRGDVDVPLPGFPDVLTANYSKAADDGRFVGYIGDSYTMLVSYDENGPVRIETLHPYGSSSKPDSPHYTDQMEMFSKKQTKVMTMDKEEIFNNAENIYQPNNRENLIVNEAK